MHYLLSGTFWASLVFGWFVTLFCLAVLVHIFGSDTMTGREAVVVQVAVHTLAIAAGVEYGRGQARRR